MSETFDIDIVINVSVTYNSLCDFRLCVPKLEQCVPYLLQRSREHRRQIRVRLDATRWIVLKDFLACSQSRS